MLLHPRLFEGIILRLKREGYPAQPCLGENDPEPGMTFQDARNQEVTHEVYRAEGPGVGFERLRQGRRISRVRGELKARGCARMKAKRNTQFLARAPERFVLRIVSML